MSGTKLQKRDFDFFVSYGRSDFVLVSSLVKILKHLCGLRLWFDDDDGNAAQRSDELLGNAIGNARGTMFFLSEAWKQSSWCKGEYNVSLSEQRGADGFEIVCVRLDDVEPPAWMQVAEIVDLRQMGPSTFARLLRSLASDVPHRFDNAEDVYLAAPWSRDSLLAREAFDMLRVPGWRLVGDAPNLKHFGEDRIEAIMRTTRGVVALMPHDPSQQEGATSPYILQEARLALKLDKRLLLLAEPGVTPPMDLLGAAFRGSAVVLESGADGKSMLKLVLEAFDDVLQHVVHDDSRAFVFFAASLRGDASEADDIASVVERASNMSCVRGERLPGNNVQVAIIGLISKAAVVIADVTDDHRNTLIEAGIAMGSGTPLKLICRAPAEGPPMKKRFMFEGHEVLSYSTAEERLALCYYLSRQFRRKIYVRR